MVTIRASDGAFLCDGRALLATGLDGCLIDHRLASKVGLRLGDVYAVHVTSDDGVGFGTGVAFGPLADRYPATIVLGMSFLRHFEVVFDGPEKAATLRL